jgi:hypothetical protein
LAPSLPPDKGARGFEWRSFENNRVCSIIRLEWNPWFGEAEG